MDENRQRIAKCSKEASKNPNYDQCKLEDLLSAIISKTSVSGTKLRNEVQGYTESAIAAKSTKISVGRDSERSSIIVRIQLVGHSEKWILHSFLKKDIQQNVLIFLDEMKKAAQAVCAEEDEKRILPDKGQGEGVPGPSPDEGVGVQGSASNDDIPKSQPKKRRQRRTASIVTDKVILEILESWMKNSAGVKKMHQAEFWDIISSLGITINRLLVLSLLKKKGIVDVSLPIKRKPMVEITQLGIDILEDHKRQLRAEKLEEEKKESLQKALEFPGQFLSSLKKLQYLRVLCTQYEEREAAKKKVMRKIADLQVELSKQEKELSEMETANRKCIDTMQRSISLVDLNNIDALIEVAEKSAQQN